MRRRPLRCDRRRPCPRHEQTRHRHGDPLPCPRRIVEGPRRRDRDRHQPQARARLLRRRDDPAGRSRVSRERPNRRAAPARAAHDRRPRDKPQIDDSMMSASTRKRAWPCCSASSRHVARAPTGHGLRRSRRTAMGPDLALRRLHGLGPRRADDLAAHQAVGLDLALPRLWLAFAHHQFRPRQRAEVTGRRDVLSTAKVEGVSRGPCREHPSRPPRRSRRAGASDDRFSSKAAATGPIDRAGLHCGGVPVLLDRHRRPRPSARSARVRC